MPGFTEHTRAVCNEADNTLFRSRAATRDVLDRDTAGPEAVAAVAAITAVADQLRALRLVIAEHGDDR